MIFSTSNLSLLYKHNILKYMYYEDDDKLETPLSLQTSKSRTKGAVVHVEENPIWRTIVECTLNYD